MITIIIMIIIIIIIIKIIIKMTMTISGIVIEVIRTVLFFYEEILSI